jgi:hypothetical protein
MKTESVENYAQSLLKHDLYSTIDAARTESLRWHKKVERGLTEPMQCPYRADIETTITKTEDSGMIVEQTFPKN